MNIEVSIDERIEEARARVTTAWNAFQNATVLSVRLELQKDWWARKQELERLLITKNGNYDTAIS